MELIAIDLDGTLLNRNNEISRENVAAIREARAKGTEVVIATGRAEFDVREILSKAEVEAWVIGANGATIHDPEGNLFHSVPISPKDTEMILKWLEDHHFYYEVFSDDAILTPQNGRELVQVELDRLKSANPETDVEKLEAALAKQWSQTGFQHVSSYRDIIHSGQPIYNVLAFSFDHDKLDLGWRTFESAPNLTLVSSANHNFELEHLNASKGIAVEKLARHLGYQLSKTAVIGDSPNDLSMFAVAHHGAAMGNAVDEVKKASTFVTKTNDEDGVAYAISHWLAN